jgi:hypothetical protein
MSTAATAAATSGLVSFAAFLAGACLAGVAFFAAGAAFLAALFAVAAFFAAGAFFAAAFLAGEDFAAVAFLAGAFFAALVFLAGDFFLAAVVAMDFFAALADEEWVTVFSVFAVDFLAGDALVTEVFFDELVAFLPSIFLPPGSRRVIERREGPVAGFTGTFNLTDQ